MKKRMLNNRLLILFKEYLIKEEKSKATVEKYLRDVQKFADYLQGCEVAKEQ